MDNAGVFSGVSAMSSPQQLAVDSSGNLYIADSGNNRVIEVSPSGAGTLVSLGGFTLNNPEGVAVDNLGNIFIADSGNNRVIEVTSSGSTLLSTALDSPISSASLSDPVALAIDTFNNLYIVDKGNNRVVQVTAAPGLEGNTVSTYQSLDAPVGVTVANNGVIYIVDGSDQVRVAIHDPQGDLYDLFDDDDTAYFGTPTAIAIDSKGGFYLTNVANGTAGSGVVNLFHQGSADFAHVQLGSSGAVQTLQFQINGLSNVTGVAIYTAGAAGLPNPDFAIAANSGTPCVTGSNDVACTVNVQFTPQAAGLRRGALVLSYTNDYLGSGNFTVPLFGVGDGPVAALSPAVAGAVSPGSFTFATPFHPYQTATDGAGNIYATDYANNQVLKFPAGGGSATVVNISTLQDIGTISNPTGIAIDGAGNLFIADSGNNRIVELTPAGASEVINIIGSFSGFSNPQSLFINGPGDLLVDDAGNNRIVDLTVAYSATDDNTLDIVGAFVMSTGNYSLSTGTATGTPYNFSTSSAFDLNDGLYIADDVNSRVLKIDRFGKSSTVNFSSLSTALTTPHSLAFDPMGNLYVMDAGGTAGAQRIIQQFTTGANTTLAFSGSALGSSPNQLAVDAKGNVLAADYSVTSGQLLQINAGQSTFTFPTTAVSAASSPQTATVTNLGDLDLLFPANPSYTANFSENTDDTNLCTSSTSLTVGLSCDVSIQFSPQSSGALSASIAVTENAQIGGAPLLIGVSGTAIPGGDVTAIAEAGNSPATAPYGQPITIAVKVTDTTTPGSIPTGSVTFSDALTSNSATAALDSTGTAYFVNNQTLGIGNHVISVSYGGVTGSFLQAPILHFSINITQAGLTIVGANTVSATAGQTGSTSITLTPATSGGTAPTGSITYTISGNGATIPSAGSALTTQNGNVAAATLSIPNNLAAGTYTLSVTYAGDTNYQGATQILNLVVSKVGAKVTLISSSSSAQPGAAVTFTATVTATGGTPTGSVSFYDGSTPLMTVALANSQASYTTSALAVGQHSIKAVYLGDTTFQSASSSVIQESVGKSAATVSLVSSLNPAILTSAVTFTSAVSAASGSPTGSISFFDGATLLMNVPLTGLQASYTTSSLAVGTHTITATYSGDSNFATATGAAVSELVQDFTVSTPTSGTTSTPTATVVPGGTATFTLNIGPSVGTVFPAAVTLSLSGLPPGATGTLSPSTLPAGSSLSSVTLTIQLPQTAALHEEHLRNLRLAGALSLALLCMPLAGRMRRAGRRLSYLLCLLFIVALSAGAIVGLAGCGAKDTGYFGQQPQTYNISIIATSSSLQHSTSVTLTVE